MFSCSPTSFFKGFLRVRRKTRDTLEVHDRLTARDTGIEIVPEPVLAHSQPQLPSTPGPHESTVISPTYRTTSDAAQTFLPPVQAVADLIPGVGGIIKGVIGGILSILQLVDRYIQNKDDLEKLALRLHLLRNHIDNAPVARTPFEEALRLRLLSELQKAQFQLEKLGKRIRGVPALTQDIAGCIVTINNHLFEYMVLSQMQLQNDVSEIKSSIIECHSRQMQLIENFVTTGTPGRLSRAISRGYAILVDATGREHTILLDQCRYLDQLDAMMSVVLFQCRPDEAEIQRWYIKRNLYDFVIYNRNDSDVTRLTNDSDIWSSMVSGTRIIMRVIMEEVVYSTVTATYECPCGTMNTMHVSIENLMTALQRSCTITCRHCERRFQVSRTQEARNAIDNTTSQQHTGTTPMTEAKYLIRNFLAKQVFVRVVPTPLVSPRQEGAGMQRQRSYWRMYLNNFLCGRYGHTRPLSWTFVQSGPSHDTRWLAFAYFNGIEYGRGVARDRGTAMEIAAETTYRALTSHFN